MHSTGRNWFECLTKSLPFNREIYDWDTLYQKAEDLSQYSIIERNEDLAISISIDTPDRLFEKDHNHFVIMIDEIQYMTKYLYKDKEEKVQAYNFPGIFHV